MSLLPEVESALLEAIRRDQRAHAHDLRQESTEPLPAPPIGPLRERLDARQDANQRGLERAPGGGSSGRPARRGALGLGRLSFGGLFTTVAVIGAIAIAVVALATLGHRRAGNATATHPPSSTPAVPHRGFRGPQVALTPSYGPTLTELLHNFAFLRRPQTSSDRSGAVDAACGCRLQYMRHVRDLPGGNRLFVGVQQLGAAGGVQLSYFVMEPNGDSYGASWSGGFYDALPDEVPGRTYLSFVPDGVASATWTFACRGTPSRCAGVPSRTVTVPVLGNIAATNVPFPTCASPADIAPSERRSRQRMIAAMSNCLAPRATAWHAADGQVVASFPRGYGNLAAPPFVKGSRGARNLKALDSSGVGPTKFGESFTAASRAIDSLLGPLSFTQQPVAESSCGIHRSVWASPATATPLTIYERGGRFVGYQYGVPVDLIGLALGPGATLFTADGLTIGDTVRSAQRIYGPGFSAHVTPGRPNNNEVWQKSGAGGALSGTLEPSIYPVRSVTAGALVATITAGQTNCG